MILLSLRIPFLRTFSRTARFPKRIKTNVKSVFTFEILFVLVSPVWGRGGGGGEPSARRRRLGPGEELCVLLAHGIRPGEPAPGGVAVIHRVSEVTIVK